MQAACTPVRYKLYDYTFTVIKKKNSTLYYTTVPAAAAAAIVPTRDGKFVFIVYQPRADDDVYRLTDCRSAALLLLLQVHPVCATGVVPSPSGRPTHTK